MVPLHTMARCGARACAAAGGLAALSAWVALAPVAALAAAPGAATPLINLTIEMRVVDEAAAATPGAGGGDFVVSTQRDAAPAAETMQVSVLAGQWGFLRLGRELPIQWLQAASSGGAASAAAAASAAGGRGSGKGTGTGTGTGTGSSYRGSVVGGLAWLHAGSALAVRPLWPGGRGDVVVEIRYESTAVDDTAGAALPAPRSLQAGTTLRLPPGQWTTFATTGPPARPATDTTGDTAATTWSTAPPAERARRLLQLRVTPP